MYKFATFLKSNVKQVDYIYDEDDNFVGAVGVDTEGLYLNLKKNLQLSNLIILLEQIEGASHLNEIKEIEINYIPN